MKLKLNILFVIAVFFLLMATSFAQDKKSYSCYIILDVEFLKTGKVGDVSVSATTCHSESNFEQMAFDQAKKIKFSPAKKDGKAITVNKKVRYTFKELDDETRAKSDNLGNEKMLLKQDLTIVGKPKAGYPTSNGGTVCITGIVRLKVAFLANGKIGQISVVKGLPFGATENAIKVARKMTFIPMKRNGIPVSVSKIVAYNFGIY